MEHVNSERYINPIEQALRNKNESLLEDALYKVESELWEHNRLFEMVLEGIIRILKSRSLCKSKLTYQLYLFLDTQWEYLSPKQKKNLLKTIEKRYFCYKDWMTCFLISEVLGKWFGNRAGLKLLFKLSKVKGEIGSRYIPHAFEHMALEAPESYIRIKAFHGLERLINCSTLEISSEARTSVRRLLAKKRTKRVRLD